MMLMKWVLRKKAMLLIGLVHLLSLLECSLLTNAILDPHDFLALQSIRNGLQDMPGSDFFSSWDFTAEPCDFADVYCDGDRVIALNLGDPRAGSPGLTGQLDPAIERLFALAEFTIVAGRIVGTLPETLSQLKNLRFLAVSRNFISGEIPVTLGQLRALRTLDLSYNQLNGSIPQWVNERCSLMRRLQIRCESWRFSVETNDAELWSQIPARYVGDVQEYMTVIVDVHNFANTFAMCRSQIH